MESVLPQINDYIGKSHVLHGVCSDWESTLRTNRENLIEGLQIKYPGVDTLYDAWRQAILLNDVESVRSTLSILTFSDKDLFWWSQVYSLSPTVQMRDSIAVHIQDKVPLGILNVRRQSESVDVHNIRTLLQCQDIDYFKHDAILQYATEKGINISDELHEWIYEPSREDQIPRSSRFSHIPVWTILHLYRNGYLPDDYNILIDRLIYDIPYDCPHNLICDYTILQMRMDAYRSTCSTLDKNTYKYLERYAIGRVLQDAITTHLDRDINYVYGPYFTYAKYMYKGSVRIGSILRNLPSVPTPETAVLDHILREDKIKLLLGFNPDLFNEPVIQLYLRRNNVRIDWYTYLLFGGHYPSDIPANLWIDVLHVLVQTKGHERKIHRILLQNRGVLVRDTVDQLLATVSDCSLSRFIEDTYDRLK